MAYDSSETSESIRQRGNEHFKAGRYAAAVSLYRKAVQLAPQETAPLTNLSIALYESADYDGCDEACTKALTLLQDCAQDAAAKQKIYLRQARARCAMMKLNHLERVLEMLVDSPDKKSLQRPLEALRAVRAHIQDSKAFHTRLILDLPRYKSMVRTIQEYYTVGHDTPEPLYDPKLLDTSRNKISLMFAGIGDARNLFCTLLRLATDEGQPDSQRKLFHFTILDIKPAAIARDLVVLLLLGDIASDMDTAVKHKLLPCLYYTYLAPIMPRGLYDVLQKRIKTLVQMLEGQQELPSFLDVPSLYRPDILRVLRQWQREAGEEYSTARMRDNAIIGRKQTELQGQSMRMQYGIMAPPDRVAKGCAKEKKFYEATGLLPLTSERYKVYRPELRACIEGYHSSPLSAASDHVAKAGKIGDDTWAPNVTFVDLDWQSNKPKEDYDIDVGNDIYLFAAQLDEIGLVPKHPRGLFDYVESWFVLVARALNDLKQRLKIEACVGDVTAVLEQIRHGVVGHREQNETDNDTTTTPAGSAVADASVSTETLDAYPQAYDRIHLSNIPDYISGPLSSYLYALPITYDGKASYITSTNLRNPPRFPTIASFNNEYVALSAPTDLAKVFQVRMQPLEDPYEALPTCRYNIWQHQPNTSRELSNLMARDKLEAWLQRLFLKIAIPKQKQAIEHTSLIYSPLNFTIFFRLLTHLHNVGYPAHWLSGFWSEILSGKLRTSARAPRTEPLSIKEVKANMPVIEHSTAPFVAELTTLTALWQPVLPFIVPAPDLPWLQDVHTYSVRFKHVSDEAANNPTFILVFYDKKLSSTTSLNKYLLDDELGFPKTSPDARRVNERFLHIVTTWKYDRPCKTATFWFRQDEMTRMTWMPRMRIAIWRTDNWKRQSSARTIDSAHDHGSWIRGENEPMPEKDISSNRDEDDDEICWGHGERNADDEDDGEPPYYLPPPAELTLPPFLEAMLRAMPGDSPAQRMALGESLMKRGHGEMEERKRQGLD